MLLPEALAPLDLTDEYIGIAICDLTKYFDDHAAFGRDVPYRCGRRLFDAVNGDR